MAGTLSVEGLHGQFDFITVAGDGSISYDGRDVPFGSNDAGKPVALTGDLQVGLAADAAVPYGSLIRVEADKTCVIGKGNVQEFNIGGTPPTVGSAVVADGAGNVRDANGAATPAEVGTGIVLHVDATRGIAWVDLG